MGMTLATESSAPPRSRLWRPGDGRRRGWVAAAAAGYLVAAAWLVHLSRYEINPDGLAYIQIARHWLAGRADLAMNAYWGPLLSWLLMPLLAAGVEAALAAKLLGAGCGLLFAGGVAALTARLAERVPAPVAWAAGLLAALTMVVSPVTPDLLLSALLTWYFVLALPLADDASPRRALAAGMVGALAYLAKAYALPFVAMHLSATCALRWLRARRGLAGPGSARCLAGGWAALALLAGPWVVLISLHEGTPTFGTSGRLTEAFLRARALNRPMAMEVLQAPRAGRLHVWENPGEIPPECYLAPPLPTAQLWAQRLYAAFANTPKALDVLKGFDPLGLLHAGWLVALVLLVWRLRRGPSARSPDRMSALPWACASVALYAGGYVLVLVEERYLWPVHGLLAAMALAAPSALATRLDLPADAPAARALRRAVTVLLLGSLAYAVALRADTWNRSWGRGADFLWLHETAAALDVRGPVASNKWHEGMFVAYWENAPYLGSVEDPSPETFAAELAPFGRAEVLVFYDDVLAQRLDNDARFRRMGACTAGRYPAHLFEFRP